MQLADKILDKEVGNKGSREEIGCRTSGFTKNLGGLLC